MEARHINAPGIIYDCCEELEDLSEKAEVIGWLPALEGEAIGEDFYRGVGHIMDDIQHGCLSSRRSSAKRLARCENCARS